MQTLQCGLCLHIWAKLFGWAKNLAVRGPPRIAPSRLLVGILSVHTYCNLPPPGLMRCLSGGPDWQQRNLLQLGVT